VQIYTCNGTGAQQFMWGPASRLYNLQSQLCVAPRAGATARGTPLVLAPCTGSTVQKWDASYLVATRGELSSVLGAAHQICLTAPSAGAGVVVDPCTTSAGQVVLHRIDQLRVLGQCLTAVASGPVAWASVRLQPCNGGGSQTFTAQPDGSLRNPLTALCLTVQYAHTAPGTPVWLNACRSTTQQRWRLPG
jgi:hypothetical protein